MTDKDIEMVQRCLTSLGEHFDTVQIFVTRHEAGVTDGGTVAISMGCGNNFAREGQVRNWLIKNETIARNEIEE